MVIRYYNHYCDSLRANEAVLKRAHTMTTLTANDGRRYMHVRDIDRNDKLIPFENFVAAVDDTDDERGMRIYYYKTEDDKLNNKPSSRAGIRWINGFAENSKCELEFRLKNADEIAIPLELFLSAIMLPKKGA